MNTWILALIISGDLYVVDTDLSRENCLKRMAATETTLCLPADAFDLNYLEELPVDKDKRVSL